MDVSLKMSLEQRYPTVWDLQRKARKRLPHFSWAYLETGTGDEQGLIRNQERMANVTLIPRILKGEVKPDMATLLFGQEYASPFGVAPIGLTGLIWPKADRILARTAKRYRLPFCLSAMGSDTPETIAPLVGDMGWFQLYPPRDKEIRDDLLQRAKASGFKTLVVTADAPVLSRRERMMRAGLIMPPAITPRFVFQVLTHPSWTLATLRTGVPNLRTMVKYAGTTDMVGLSEFVNRNICGTLSCEYLREVRDQWDGPLVLKGVLHSDDVERGIQVGVDGVIVSNHGARQFNGAPAAIDVLPSIADQFRGKTAILYDSGVYSGLDILRAITLGADFVFLGRAFMYAVAALGDLGGDHVTNILIDDLKNNMVQMGTSTIEDVKQQMVKG
ncbi:MAG: alpha-hydroxy-acid oxidizing protein [Deltaproteobacteria bacterium]|nr:alpha-hydroxy-acid oxidizing protein [Deltaproteobacteria bacterium]